MAEVAEGVDVGVLVGVTVGVGVAVAVGVGGAAAQNGAVIEFVSSVTAPLRASIRPRTVVPVVTEMLVRARTLPRKVELVPSVADEPTCQKTLHA